MGWAPYVSAAKYAGSLATPLFAVDNFRPIGALYFTAMSRTAAENFPPYVTPLFLFHLLNSALLFALARRMKIGIWHALAATAFFTLSAGAMEAYWKPMYVYDLFCATFSLASILLYASRRWILSFLAFWCAYKSKELAVMLPIALLAWEHWLGDRRYLRLAPFFAVSLSFGLQGLLRNPNENNEYTLRFNWQALRMTVPYYAHRFLLFRASGLLLAPLLLIRDRRIWFALTATGAFLFILLFLPGRLYEAYAYLPLACATLATVAAFSHLRPPWIWVALIVWILPNVRDLHRQQRAILAADNGARAFVSALNDFATGNPQIRTFVYDGVPRGFHDWGVRGAWSIIHGRQPVAAYYYEWPEGRQALAHEVVGFGTWRDGRLTVTVRNP